MKLTKILFSIVLSLSFIAVFTISTVSASWFYYSNAPYSQEEANFHVNEFGYTPEEVLPGGDHQKILGQNHLILTDLILNENKKVTDLI